MTNRLVRCRAHGGVIEGAADDVFAGWALQPYQGIVSGILRIVAVAAAAAVAGAALRGVPDFSLRMSRRKTTTERPACDAARTIAVG